MGRVWKTTAIGAVLVTGAALAGPMAPARPDGGDVPVSARAAQDRATLAFVRVHAFKRSVSLRRRAILADWGVRNTSQADAPNLVSCVEFPAGFRISYAAVNRPANVRITNNNRKACIPRGTIYVDSEYENLVEGYAPRRVGNFKVKFTAVADNADKITKIVTLRILRRCSARQCPGFRT